MSDDAIANALNMNPLVQNNSQDIALLENESTDLVSIDHHLEEAEEDYKEIRHSIKCMISESQQVFDTAKIVAVQGQDAKSIEAFAKVLDSMIKANKELMNVHKDIYALNPPIIEETPKQEAEVINNIIFTGTADDLFKLLKDKGVKSFPTEE